MPNTQNQVEDMGALITREDERVSRLQKHLWLVTLVGSLLFIVIAFLLQSRLATDNKEPANAALESRIDNLVLGETLQLHEQIASLESQLKELTLAQQTLAEAHDQTQIRDEFRKEIARNAGENREDLEASLIQYESRLDELMSRANDPTIENEIAETKTQISNIRTMLDSLSSRVDCATLAAESKVRSLILQTRDSTVLPEEDIVISLGRYRKNKIDAVSINARALPGEPVSTRVIGQVPIGSSIEFSHDEDNYTATFTHATTRFLSSALIGLELRVVSEAMADCP